MYEFFFSKESVKSDDAKFLVLAPARVRYFKIFDILWYFLKTEMNYLCVVSFFKLPHQFSCHVEKHSQNILLEGVPMFSPPFLLGAISSN